MARGDGSAGNTRTLAEGQISQVGRDRPCPTLPLVFSSQLSIRCKADSTAHPASASQSSPVCMHDQIPQYEHTNVGMDSGRRRAVLSAVCPGAGRGVLGLLGRGHRPGAPELPMQVPQACAWRLPGQVAAALSWEQVCLLISSWLLDHLSGTLSYNSLQAFHGRQAANTVSMTECFTSQHIQGTLHP